MVYSRSDLRNQLKRHEFAPVYVLFGPETYLRDIAAKTIADRVFAPGDFRDFNETTFSLNMEGNLGKALAATEQLPMMSSRRVVRINDVRISQSGYRDTVTEGDETVLKNFLADPPAHSTVIFVADDLNGVRKMGRLLREKTMAVEFTHLSDKDLIEWAAKEFKDAGAVIDSVTLGYFMGRISPDVLRMTNEIKKLAAAALPSGVVDIPLIDSLGANNRELSNFDLTDHLIAGRHAKAVSTLEKMLDDGAEPLALLGLLGYNYRRLLMAKDMMIRGASRSDVAGILRMRYSDQEAFFAAARRAELGRLGAAIKKLAVTDVAIKSSIGGSGPAGARMQIEMLVCQLALM
jgi:DNA polymerase-3 subunit delta